MRSCEVSFFILSLQCALSLKILGIFPMAGYSQYLLGRSLMTGLAEKGHDVTLIAPYPEKHAKFRTIELTGIPEKFEVIKDQLNLFNAPSLSFIGRVLQVHGLGHKMCDLLLQHENVQKLLASNEQYDVVILEQFVDESLRGFCHHFNAHCILFSSLANSYWTDYLVGNPVNPAYIPEWAYNHAGPMDLWQRTKNTIINLSTRLMFHIYILPKQNALLKQYFPKAPPMQEILQDTSLVLLNSHVSTSPPTALVPNMIEIGGFHLSPPKKLPKDLEDFINSAKDGVVYFSMGSNLKSKEMPAHKRDAFLNAFSRLKQKVLWKFEDDQLPGQPKNLKILKWAPQQSVLAHPNVKLFMTHGGFVSTIESIYFGVPMIGIPIFGDQKMNVMEAVHRGYGVMLDYEQLSEEAVTNALNESLNIKRYTENVKTRSKIMHDQPMKPMDRAAFWIEYVARHNGAKHLRSAAMNLTWYQLMLLDVFTVIAAVTLVAVGLLFVFLRIVFCRKHGMKVDMNKKRK